MALWTKMNKSDGVKAKFVPIWMIGCHTQVFKERNVFFLNSIYS